MRVRPAEDDDVTAIVKIAVANGEHGAGADPGYIAHLRAHGRFLVAGTGGAVAGYCGTRRIGPATMLCDLFVDPARQGGGAGSALLAAAFDEPGPRFTFASQDPRAMPLYIRYGMIPRWPLLYLSGPPIGPSQRRPARPVSPRARTVPMAEAAAAELALTGVDRTSDYAYWATIAGAHGVVVLDGADVIAAGAAEPGSLTHLTTGPDHDPVAALQAALAAVEAAADGRVRLCLPGPHPAVPSLLDARWRIDEFDHHMSSAPDLLPPASVLCPSLA